MSDAVESPHLTLAKAKGELYISCAEHDELDREAEERGQETEYRGLVLSYFEFTPEQRRALNIPDNMIRLACGIEDPDDLIADLAQALETLEKALILAEPEGFVRVFVDQGGPIHDLILEYRRRLEKQKI